MMPGAADSVPEHIYTWVDVDAHLEKLALHKQWPEWLHECDAFWDGLELTVDPAVPAEEALRWLGDRFGVGSIMTGDGTPALRLDDIPGRPSRRLLPITINHREPEAHRREPRWRERRIVRSLGEPLPPPESGLPHGVRMAAFHSYKGGVGRTLHAIALADAVARKGGRVLLIDADLEAPGITWMLTGHGKRVDFSYEDFLALLHASDDGRPDEAVSLGAAYLPNQTFDNVIVMPTRRSLADIAPPKIEPTDLLTADRSIYYLTESLAELAAALNASTVLIDLRAGGSELSAPVLLDPRVQRIFVTTVSDQSLYGTDRLIRELGRRAPSRKGDPASAIIITQFREQADRSLVIEAAARLRDALAETLKAEPSEDEDRTVDNDVAVEPTLSAFQDHLLSLPANWDAVIALARRQQLPQLLETLAQDLAPPAATAAESSDEPSQQESSKVDLARRRRQLGDFATRLVHAETADGTRFLPTESLRNLLTSHRTEPPLCVVVGAKGSGKTFTQVQMCFRGTWRDYARDVGVDNVTLDARLAPVFVSRHLQDRTSEQISEVQQLACASPDAEPASQLQLRDLIDTSLRSSLSDLEWRRVWLTCMARAVGIEASPEDVEEKLVEFARATTRIFLIDGLEDLLQDFLRNDAQRQALRVLLVDCLEWLRSLRGRPLGLIVFIRRDLVQAAIKQNHSQFLARYSDYELKWNAAEALRLALWVTQQSEALPGLAPETILQARDEDLSRQLIPVWGEKMGSPRSREARSDRWFLAALSDFNGQIQARDIVTFLAESANGSVSDTRYTDRLLIPSAMRNALVTCSEKKIEAISEESPQVGALLKRLNALEAEKKRIPFSPHSVGLSSEDLDILAANGVVFREEDQYWIPEIFRHGLSFKAVGRPKILAIANLVRQRNFD
ncbi:KGGVGR-motif variant AAA ATPase [Thermopolyspora flexuosa]|jgi:MinD-like ATPase involved in chromosome partitioning or flagellar assembly|uniref:AAA domain-containing protein n=1 Tax=Thermopolyspora flexuosa TaxID=103836 RepID=A0A543IS70_9ACTN|nr:AAA family ATPase [Thermopolyspora flexuosa]TQM73425.1 AAA domain-containing protein [Thermopolyspora flexuosa]